MKPADLMVTVNDSTVQRKHMLLFEGKCLTPIERTPQIIRRWDCYFSPPSIF